MNNFVSKCHNYKIVEYRKGRDKERKWISCGWCNVKILIDVRCFNDIYLTSCNIQHYLLNKGKKYSWEIRHRVYYSKCFTWVCLYFRIFDLMCFCWPGKILHVRFVRRNIMRRKMQRTKRPIWSGYLRPTKILEMEKFQIYHIQNKAWFIKQKFQPLPLPLFGCNIFN